MFACSNAGVSKDDLVTGLSLGLLHRTSCNGSHSQSGPVPKAGVEGLHARPTMQCSCFSSPAAFQPAWLGPGQRAARPVRAEVDVVADSGG